VDSDRIVRFDPGTNAWTVFDLPVRGTKSGTSRSSSVATGFGGDAGYRTSQMGVLTLRSELI